MVPQSRQHRDPGAAAMLGFYDQRRKCMSQVRLTMAFIGLVTLAGCGEPVRGIDADAREAKAQAHEAVRVAQDAAARVEELSRPPAEPATDSH
jgi:hypothetical protein